MALLGATVPADAQTLTRSDPVGDSTPANDVTSMLFRNTGPRIKAVVSYRNLGPKHLGVTLLIDPARRGGVKFRLTRFQDFDGTWKLQLSSDWAGITHPLSCPGKRAAYDAGDRDQIVLSLPRTCLAPSYDDSKKAYLQVIGGQQEGGGVPLEFAPSAPVLVHRD